MCRHVVFFLFSDTRRSYQAHFNVIFLPFWTCWHAWALNKQTNKHVSNMECVHMLWYGWMWSHKVILRWDVDGRKLNLIRDGIERVVKGGKIKSRFIDILRLWSAFLSYFEVIIPFFEVIIPFFEVIFQILRLYFKFWGYIQNF